MWKKIIHGISINEMLYGIYMFTIWSIYLFVNYYSGKDTIIRFIWLLLLCAIMSFIVSKWIISLIGKIPAAQNIEITKKKKVFLYCVFFLISFGNLCLWYVAYFPGAFSPDSISQYMQAMTGNYNDWHPAWHTMLFFSLPLTLTGKTASIVFLQIMYFSLVLAYLGLTMYIFAGWKITAAALAYILLNPYTGCISMYPWKDVGMAITILWSVTCVTRLYYTNGQWASQKGRVTLLAILLANVTLFRHNAVLFTFPLALALFFHLERKKWLKFMLIFIAFIFMVKVPLYRSLDVGAAEKRRQETVGLPLTVIGNVVKEHPEFLDEKTAHFVYQMASQEEWTEKYVCGNFNSIKFQDTDLSVIEETKTADILKMTARCFKVAPQASCKALFMLTDMVYSIEGTIEGDFVPEIFENEIGIDYQGNEQIQSWLLWYREIMTNTVFKYIRYIGISILAMLGFMLGRSNLRKWTDWKRLLLCLPILFYNFGTMLLLSDADSRFFYASFLVCPTVILIMMKEEFKCEK